MNLKLNNITKSVISLQRFAKVNIVIATDLGLCILCTWLAFYLRLDQFIILKNFPL